ncbi:N-acetylneuraminate synthase (plasmid) [Neorhizobium galegae bv. officinalis bv. officinalis str. HAMBI 1141]|uniref:N-acetylneuraminate synthase n=1 Tax=Neorhizobium galegae bv. officinalis bv. officinalis str. HAMBI 1141 TaxID=1028801 RepID=A0A068TFY8_NEOGA|nr:N-acetylneuraminate synthase family protein [Neorhizobium galegae]CDN57303.1 N-acetylneuraminate synthase [Neorhizobium galegae bv. officinalis bv. officinalis str. HAMBI 1141]
MFRNYRADRAYIIAEIGGNFTTVDQAIRLIDEAKATGVDAVKLQTYRAETLSTRGAIFDMENTGVTSQFELFQRYEVDESVHEEVFKYAEAQGLDWFSSPSHQSDVDLLERCGVGAHKVGSDDAVNLPLLRYLANTGKPIILSTGMCTLDEVRESVGAIQEQSDSRIILLHAVTSYPTHPENVNLGAMQSLMREFPGLDVGYSDHTLTPVACLCAVAMGARAIERHFTYDKNADGPDHMLSADPDEMKWLVDAIRAFEIMRGSGVKEPAASERVTRINNRKSIVLERDMKAGDVISEADIAVKRPGTGIYPKHLEDVIGRKAASDLKADTVLQWSNLA